jgi:hypothetical protein
VVVVAAPRATLQCSLNGQVPFRFYNDQLRLQPQDSGLHRLLVVRQSAAPFALGFKFILQLSNSSNEITLIEALQRIV